MLEQKNICFYNQYFRSNLDINISRLIKKYICENNDFFLLQRKCTQVDAFHQCFPDPDFSGSNPEIWPIRTQEKKSDPDPEKNLDAKTCFS